MWDRTLVSVLSLHGVASGGHLIANDDAAWRWVTSSLVRALTSCVPLLAEAPLGAWFHRRTQASHVVGLDRVEDIDGY